MQSTVQIQGGQIRLSKKDLDLAHRLFLQIPDRDERVQFLGGLGLLYHGLYENSQQAADLEKAIFVFEEAMGCTSTVPRQLAMGFGAALEKRFNRKGDIKDMDRAIQLYQSALDLLSDANQSGKRALLSNIGIALYTRFNRLGNPKDIKNAILSIQKLVDLMPDGHPDQPSHLSDLGVVLKARFNLLGDLKDLENAVLSNQRAVDLTPDSHPDKPRRLSNLGTALQTRFGRLGNITDLKNAILSQRKAVDLTTDDHPAKPDRLSNLGAALGTRFDHLGNLADLENAILSIRKAADLTPDGHPNKPGHLSNLASALAARFNRLGNLKDLENEILSFQNAVDLTPDGHPNKPVYLSNLGIALEKRFRRFGNLTDLENAILNIQKAVSLTPDGHPNKPSHLSNLGSTLQTRFHQLKSLEDLENAIWNNQKAMDLTPDVHPSKPIRLINLGDAFLTRFTRLGNIKDIENAISSKQRALDLIPDGHPDKPLILSNLGSALLTRFDRLGSLPDLENAILSQEKAVALMPRDHPDNPRRLSNLGNALRVRFVRFKAFEDIENAILCHRKAVDLTPDGHPSKPDILHNLGSTLLSRFDHLHDLADLESALYAYSQAARSPAGSPAIRFSAARTWAKRLDENSRSSLTAYGCAIDLLPRIAWLGLPVIDQHALLADVGSIVREAVSAAIKSRELETAVEWAEQGRSIVWQNILGLRTPIDDLRAAHPQLANQIQHIARKIEGFDPNDIANTNRNDSGLAIEWENTVEEIRKLPGLERFLKPKTFRQLTPAAYEGPVAILNVDDSRSDALVLTASNSEDKHVSVVHVPLTRFSYENGQKLRAKLIELLNLAHARDRGELRMTGRLVTDGGADTAFRKILRILWLDVAQPVIDALGYQAKPAHLPRIWWCATGPLAFLPIHAAGIYDGQMGEKLSDYVVSSYTPTITAILDLSAPKVGDDFTILTVAQPNTPNATPIPKTEDEVKQVESLAGGVNVISLKNDAATVERVLQAMRDTDWIHLACHGRQMTGDPMKSGLLLHDRILELSEIVRHALPRADFAFLSACQTAVGDERIADESVHLAAGMFMAGYRGVIATMWSIKDKDAPEIAEDVYTRILRDGRPDRKKAAHALHDAVKRLRDSGAKFVDWVPFIHLGR